MLLAIALLSISFSSFAQSKKIALLVATENNEVSYNSVVVQFFMAHLKRVPGLELQELKVNVSKQVSEEISNENGKFSDNDVIANAVSKGIKRLLVIYYSATPLEKATAIKGVTKLTYGCRLNYYVQLINAANGEIMTSKQFYGSVGTAINGKDNYKTKEAAVQAAFEVSGPADYNDHTTINIDNYLNKVADK